MIIRGRKTLSKFGPLLRVAVPINEHGRRKVLHLVLLPSIYQACSSVLLLCILIQVLEAMSSGFWDRPKTGTSLEMQLGSSTILGLLRHQILWTEKLPYSWPFHYETAPQSL